MSGSNLSVTCMESKWCINSMMCTHHSLGSQSCTDLSSFVSTCPCCLNSSPSNLWDREYKFLSTLFFLLKGVCCYIILSHLFTRCWHIGWVKNQDVYFSREPLFQWPHLSGNMYVHSVPDTNVGAWMPYHTRSVAIVSVMAIEFCSKIWWVHRQAWKFMSVALLKMVHNNNQKGRGRMIDR